MLTNPITISGDGRTQSQITVTGSNARSINFGNVGFGTPTQSVSRKLILKDDSTASVKIGVQDKTTSADSRLWLQTGLDGSIDFYRDNIRMTRFDKDNIEFTGATISFGKPATASLFGGYSVNLNVENEAEMDHISLSRWADVILVVPATANTISKLSSGSSDDLASTVILASDKNIFLTLNKFLH